MAAVGDIHKVSFYISMGNQVAMNTVHFRVQTVVAAAAGDGAWADGYMRWATPFYQNLITVAASLHGCLLQRIRPTKGFAAPSTLPPVTGQGVGTGPHASQICGVLSFFDATVTRAGRGRIYLPFPDMDSDTGQGVPDPAYVGEMQGLGNQIQNGFTVQDAAAGAIGTVIGVLNHRLLNTDTPMVRARANSIWGTQRRRGGYGQPNKIPPQLPQ